MTLRIERENYSIELRAKVLHPGYKGCYRGPWETSYQSEGPELEFEKAWIVQGKTYKEVDCKKIIKALDRRSDRWLEDAVLED